MFTLIKSLQPYSDGSYEYHVVDIDGKYYMIHAITYNALPYLTIIKERNYEGWDKDHLFTYEYGEYSFLWNVKFFYTGNEKKMRYDPIEELSYSSSSSEHYIGDTELDLMEFLSKVGGE